MLDSLAKTIMFQPFLRFWFREVARRALETPVARFQPFLRFYRSDHEAFLRWREEHKVSTLLEILLLNKCGSG